MCEEQAQGNGKTPVRVMRHRTRARRGGGIPPTKYRAADGGCSAREESRFSPKRETNACAVCPVPEDALRGLLRRRQRGGARENETSRVGLRPEGIYVYVERSQGHANRPFLVGEHRCGEASRMLEGNQASSTMSGKHTGQLVIDIKNRSLAG